MLVRQRGKRRNEEMERGKWVSLVVGGLAETGAAYGMGYYMGTLEKEGQARDIMGVDIDLGVGLAGKFIAATGWLGKGVSPWIGHIAQGSLSGWAFSVGASHGKAA